MITTLKYAVALSLLCATGLLHAETEISALGKTWQVGFTAKNAQQHLTEYVLPGQSVKDWRELLTRQLVTDPSERISLPRLVELIRDGFGKDCKEFSWTIVKQTKSEVLYAWSHSGCANYPAQAERSLIARVPKGVCRWAYATKSPPLDESTAAQVDATLTRQSCE